MENSAAQSNNASPYQSDRAAFIQENAASSEDHSPFHESANDSSDDVEAREVAPQNGLGDESTDSLHAAAQLPLAPPPTRPYTSGWPPYVVLVLSCLSVAAAGLGGNVVRFAMENCFVKHPFFAKYYYLEPNSIGSFIMGLAVTLLPPETHLPLTYRAVCVGFCGSFTTFSTWIVKLMSQNTAGDAFEHLFIGSTMPIVFFIWGRDLGRCLRWCCAELLHSPWESWTAHRRVLQALDCTVFALLVVAAVLAPVLLQVYINKGRVRIISTDDIRMVVFAPLGAAPRFLLSFYLNKRDCVRHFPLGTLAANLVAVLLAIIMLNMQVLHLSNTWFVIVQQGITGALSTVSSLVNEIITFHGNGRTAFAYLYSVITVGVSIFICGIGRPQMYRRTVS